MVEVINELEVCQDCLCAIANGDYSGMDEETAFNVLDGICRLQKGGRYLVAGDKEFGFSHCRCDCCDGLAGNRYEAILLSK